MAIKIAFFIFVIVCSVVFAEDLQECTMENIEECSKPMVNVQNATTEELCHGHLDKSKSCWEKLPSVCVLNDKMDMVRNKSLESIETSRAACKNIPEAPTAPETKAPTCSEDSVDSCMEGNTGHECTVLDKAIECYEKQLVHCPIENVTAALTMHLNADKKNRTELKCCDVAAIEACGEIQADFTNKTANKNSCKSVSDMKMCLDKEMKSCHNEDQKQMYAARVDALKEGQEVCDGMGYKIGDNSGNSQQPAVILLSLALLMSTAFYRMF